MFDFDTLEKRCRRYHFKKNLLWILLFLAVLGGTGFGYWWITAHKAEPVAAVEADAYSHKNAQSSSVNVVLKSSSSKSSLAKKPKPKCWGVQLFYAYERFQDQLFSFDKKAARFGFDCFVKRGKKLPNGDRQIFLVCNVQKSKRDLKPWIDLAKKNHFDYQIVRAECRYISDKKLPASSKISTNITPLPKHKVNPSRFFTDKIVSTRELNTSQLEKLFDKRGSYDLAIQIAERYFDAKRYKKALYWAKKANRLDKEQEDAWILYAKSLYHLGNKKEAKQILRVFLDYKESKRAQKLLKEWR